VALASAYTNRGELLHALVRGAYNAADGDPKNRAQNAGNNAAFAVANDRRFSQGHFVKRLVSRDAPAWVSRRDSPPGGPPTEVAANALRRAETRAE
jgi:hypothetical protein